MSDKKKKTKKKNEADEDGGDVDDRAPEKVKDTDGADDKKKDVDVGDRDPKDPDVDDKKGGKGDKNGKKGTADKSDKKGKKAKDGDDGGKKKKRRDSKGTDATDDEGDERTKDKKREVDTADGTGDGGDGDAEATDTNEDGKERGKPDAVEAKPLPKKDAVRLYKYCAGRLAKLNKNKTAGAAEYTNKTGAGITIKNFYNMQWDSKQPDSRATGVGRKGGKRLASMIARKAIHKLRTRASVTRTLKKMLNVVDSQASRRT